MLVLQCGEAGVKTKFLEQASGTHMKYGFKMNERENPMRTALKAFKNIRVDVIPAYNRRNPLKG
ncbi:hypothetical protein DRO69_07100 [Candidatus Bathyarchaeota archaeon]|nr:MAG: hypothetical protein DRO69_07100 [Candidatus Bathyarchaeota archaeon]